MRLFVLLCLTVAAAPAATISWESAGQNYDFVHGPFTAIASTGAQVSVSHEGPTFVRLDQSDGWYGNFQPFERLLWTYYGGAITLDFGGLPVLSLSVQVQPDLYGAYTALLQTFDANGFLLAQSTAEGVSHSLADGSAALLTLAPGIFHSARISLVAAGDPSSFAIGGVSFQTAPPPLTPNVVTAAQIVESSVAVPEPSTLALMLTAAAFLAVCAAPSRNS